MHYLSPTFFVCLSAQNNEGPTIIRIIPPSPSSPSGKVLVSFWKYVNVSAWCSARCVWFVSMILFQWFCKKLRKIASLHVGSPGSLHVKSCHCLEISYTLILFAVGVGEVFLHLSVFHWLFFRGIWDLKKNRTREKPCVFFFRRCPSHVLKPKVITGTGDSVKLLKGSKVRP